MMHWKAVVIAVSAAGISANAAQLLLNGGFESGLTGWVATNSPGRTGGFTAASLPVTSLNGNPTVGPQSGTSYAVNDSFDPGSSALTQTFFTPLDTTSAVLSFSIFVNDQFGSSGAGGRIDLLSAAADSITGVPITTFYGPVDTIVTGGAPNPYVNVLNLNITAFLTPGVSYKLRIFESDVSGPINVGVDSFSLVTTGVPEPATAIPTAIFTLFVVWRARRRERDKFSGEPR